MQYHPLANVFPLLDGVEFDALVDDVRAHGILEPIWLYEGAIIDGRNRHRASVLAGVDCPVREYFGADPVSFVVSLNLNRRHLDESQRSFVGAKLETLKQGRPGKDANLHLNRDAVADLLNVSPRSIASAKRVIDDGATELQEAVQRGQVSVSTAADIATKPQDEQREIVARGEKEILEAAKLIRAEKAEVKKEERLASLRVIAAKNADLPISERKYAVIYADPPWSFDVWSGAGKDRAAENHYPTMSQEAMEAMSVSTLAADDCALFMWAVMPQLPEAIRLIEAWGFQYKTCAFVWIKQTKDEERFATGMGYWTRANAEVCLLATRGTPQRLNADVHQVVMSPRLQHSVKPDEIATRIERLVPGPYIELFSRRPRIGWDAWGNQSEAA